MNYSDFVNVDYNQMWIPSNIKNGRINIIDDKKRNPIIIRKSILPDDNTGNISQSITKNDLSNHFFSKRNIEKIQLLIIRKVYIDSNKRFEINKQSEQELLIIMRSYYFQYSKNLNFDYNKQINDLNKMVIDWCSNNIITNMEQYIHYKKNASTLPMPLERAQLPTQKGTKTLEIKSFI